MPAATTPHHFAVIGSVKKIEEYLNEGGEVNVQDAQGNTILMNACVAGKVEVVKMLLERGATMKPNNGGFKPGEQFAIDIPKAKKDEITNLLFQKTGEDFQKYTQLNHFSKFVSH
mmetsp:Transcript_27801/g.35975  ORF Transcript_27801/g.35975 Transcript_27801/m.35975 type:complete len:115 (-) Transcript_27801:396-740(-)